MEAAREDSPLQPSSLAPAARWHRLLTSSLSWRRCCLRHCDGRALVGASRSPDPVNRARSELLQRQRPRPCLLKWPPRTGAFRRAPHEPCRHERPLGWAVSLRCRVLSSLTQTLQKLPPARPAWSWPPAQVGFPEQLGLLGRPHVTHVPGSASVLRGVPLPARCLLLRSVTFLWGRGALGLGTRLIRFHYCS